MSIMNSKERKARDRGRKQGYQMCLNELREYAFHMKNNKTGEKRIKKVKALSVTEAHCKDVGYGKEWNWTGSEPWHNVSDRAQHIGNGYYKLKEEGK